ncbi:PstS family phosphate ABC transporter substrate-binding protein [Roseateles saccharophilus]|uniref:ABC-type phosphate transport system substrate-binding protein n=2 Tax=Roseateles saccharophilus TaxID=304 RepID=A0A4R3ULV5_ROSSA|nr:substrate-binding domain-containing protein [Roseateles saccharophilus]MDG0834678.1 phosphate ABC transporter substrate-binding protein [Roseateles saccharophilus]TCU92666.1 ABC-type phosphate transport system substrate-binding protein [Roseateles saccharophilus]
MKLALIPLCAALVVGGASAATPAAEKKLSVSSIGAGAMAPLMDAWMRGLAQGQGGFVRGPRWQHVDDAAAIGALMFERADVAPMTRMPLTIELAPYAHQFHGDMMKSPELARVALLNGQPVFLAFNRRPDTPVPLAVDGFVRFALSPAGQALVASQPGFAPLPAGEADAELAKLAGYRAALDPGLPVYRAHAGVHGALSSVGSDGMKSLMDGWLRDFRALQPGVRPGDRWEHLGTLNGFHALMAGETDIAPMGRELWPDEAAAFATLRGGRAPLEIRVARGGFDTQQRTTAQAVFVNAANPIQQLTLAQLAAIFGKSPTITRWGQLGLGGEWADRPITLDVPPHVTPNAMSMQIMVLRGGPWAGSVHEASVADTAKAIAADAGAMGFGGFEDGGPGLKAVPLARDAVSPAVAGTPESAATGQYPLTRYMYIRFDRQPGRPIPAVVKEFLRYVLSRQGQEPVPCSGYYPLTAREVREELAKLN